MTTGTETLVLAVRNEMPLEGGRWQSLLNRLPAHLQWQACQFHRWEDRQASVLGKLLLIEGLSQMGGNPDMVRRLQWNDFKRPFLPGGVDFNISHTSGLVVCALRKGGRVGIDVEVKRNLQTEEYRSVFTPAEYGLISGSDDPIGCFFNFWTRKEALMKADGRGFYLSPKLFEAIADEVEISTVRWHLKKVPLPGHYVCHLATEQDAAIGIRFVELNALTAQSQEARERP